MAVKRLISKKDIIDFFFNLRKLNQHLKNSEGRNFIWGIDISLSNTALAYKNLKTYEYYAVSHKFKGSRYFRLKQLEKSFEKHMINKNPALVVIENYAFGSKFSREIIGEASYAVKRCFLRRGLPKTEGYVPTLLISPMSLKKFVFCESSRGTKKNDIHKIVSKEWGAGTRNNDESDAYVLMCIGGSLYTMSKILSNLSISKKFNERIFKKIMKGYHVIQQRVLIDVLRDNVAKREVYKRKNVRKITFSDEVGRFYPIDEN